MGITLNYFENIFYQSWQFFLQSKPGATHSHGPWGCAKEMFHLQQGFVRFKQAHEDGPWNLPSAGQDPQRLDRGARQPGGWDLAANLRSNMWEQKQPWARIRCRHWAWVRRWIHGWERRRGTTCEHLDHSAEEGKWSLSVFLHQVWTAQWPVHWVYKGGTRPECRDHPPKDCPTEQIPPKTTLLWAQKRGQKSNGGVSTETPLHPFVSSSTTTTTVPEKGPNGVFQQRYGENNRKIFKKGHRTSSTQENCSEHLAFTLW